jgi:adenylyltransferase/sulfurtransferase
MVPSCAEGGVLGVLPGIVGSLQASEVIKIITGIGETLSGRLFLIDAASFETRTMKLAKSPDTPEIKELIDYEGFCGITDDEDAYAIKEITVKDFARRIQTAPAHYQLIDVREPYERDISNIGGELLPAGEIDKWKDKIDSDKQVVLYCRSGVRSANTIRKLQNKYGFTNLYNLKGGILEWADYIDDNIAKY